MQVSMGQFAEGHLLQQLIDSTSGLWRKNIRFGLMDWPNQNHGGQISTVSMQNFIIILILHFHVKKMPSGNHNTQRIHGKNNPAQPWHWFPCCPHVCFLELQVQHNHETANWVPHGEANDPIPCSETSATQEPIWTTCRYLRNDRGCETP